MKIILTAVDESLAEAWSRFCGGFDFVSVAFGSAVDLTVDAVVSPANSFGFMDGGIDMIYSRFFGRHVQERLQHLIREHHFGELVVGAAEIVPTDHAAIPYVIAAPTMRVPMILSDTVNPYLAARAALLLVREGVFKSGERAGEPIREHVETVAFPGLGTGVGRVGPNTCARQVRAAIEEIVCGEYEFPRTWSDAQTRHQMLYTDRVRDLQRGE